MAGRERHHDLLLEEHRGRELVAQPVRVDGGERAVQLVGAQHLQQPIGGLLDHVDLDARVALVERGQRAREVVVAGRPHRADRDAPADDAGELLELGLQAVDLGEHAARVGEDDRPLGRHVDPAAGPAQDLDAELALEPADLLGECRLREVQLLRGAGEAAVTGDRLQCP